MAGFTLPYFAVRPAGNSVTSGVSIPVLAKNWSRYFFTPSYKSGKTASLMTKQNCRPQFLVSTTAIPESDVTDDAVPSRRDNKTEECEWVNPDYLYFINVLDLGTVLVLFFSRPLQLPLSVSYRISGIYFFNVFNLFIPYRCCSNCSWSFISQMPHCFIPVERTAVPVGEVCVSCKVWVTS